MQDRPVIDFSTVLASSIHDMKNSLSMLLHSLDEIGIELSTIQSPVASRLATLQYEAARVNNDLVQLLSLYKMDQNVLSVHIDEHNVLDLLEEVVSRYEPLFLARGVTCEMACDNDLFGYFDRDLLAGVIANVLANTIRYSRQRIRVSASTHGEGGIEIRIEDDGLGFPAKMLQQSENWKATPHGVPDSAIDFLSGSTNLGLFFARQIARLHQQKDTRGEIELTNGGDLGGGVFSIRLP